MKYHLAPVQGHTDQAYRHFHNMVYNTQIEYYTPFIRWEKEGVRKRDMADAFGELNSPQGVVPQIIFKNETELRNLVETLIEAGAKRIDLNMGCPFPLQTARGRGAAAICNHSLAEEIAKIVNSHPEINFSVKMRLGLKEENEWENLLEILNTIPLTHITLHPRIARQQYGGEINIEAFRRFVDKSKNKVIYNGDITSPEDVEDIKLQFPELENVMIGRGVLGRPSLFNEISEGKEWSREERIDKMLEFHRLLLRHYSNTLIGGEHQILSKIKPFWEYAEEEIGRKSWKSIKKATNMAKYNSAVATIMR